MARANAKKTPPPILKNKKVDHLLKHLYQSTLRLMTQASSEEVYRAIVREAINFLHARFGTIIISQNNILKRVYSNSPAIAVTPVRQTGRTRDVLDTQKVRVVKVNSPQYINPAQYSLKIKTIVFIPLYYSDQSVGVMNIFSLRAENYTHEELALLQLFGSMASLAIRKAQLFFQAKADLENRNAFVSFAAHEIKTPLTAISAYSQIIANRSIQNQPIPASITQNLCDEAQRLERLVKNFLSTNTQDSIIKQKVSFSQIINLAIEEIGFLYPAHEIVFANTLGDEDQVYGDPDRLLQIVTNLLTNACKFSKPRSRVEVRLTGGGEEIVLSVRDRGVGISQKDLPKIFDKFFTKSDSKSEGMGIGLYLVKQLTEAHNGSVSVTSKKGQGATFTIKLPWKV